MRKLFILCLVLFAVSCTKSNTSGKNIANNNITGRWNYYQSYISNGSAFIYTSTENLKQWIEFKEDGKFESNMPTLQKVVHYELYDSIKVKFTTSTPLTESHYFITVNSTTHALYISSADYICIEGCGDQFKR